MKGQRRAFLKMDLNEFDQSENSGWRTFADGPNHDRKCFLVGAKLLRAYVRVHRSLSDHERMILSFHAGQAYALAHQYGNAIKEFRQSFEGNAEDWDAYVRATIDFLKFDKPSLVREREKLAAIPGKLNLNVVDDLVKHFGESYADAYAPKE